MELKTNHKQDWLASLVDSDIIKLNVTSLSGDVPHEYLLYGLDRSDRNNNGRISDRWLKRYSHLEHGGWWCGTINVSTFEFSQWGCFKPDQPRTAYGNNKPIKYEHPPKVPTEAFLLQVPDRIWDKIANRWRVDRGNENHFWKWVINNPQLPIVVTEDAKKAGALLTCGYIAIALPGINNAFSVDSDSETLIPELSAFADRWREITFAFDCDRKWKTVQAVNQAISKIGHALSSLDCKVAVAKWRYTDGKGIDDLIANQGSDMWEGIYDRRLALADFEAKQNRKVPRYKLNQLLDFFSVEFDGRLAFDDLKLQIILDGQLFDVQENYRAWLCENYSIDASKENLIEALTYQAKKTASIRLKYISIE